MISKSGTSLLLHGHSHKMTKNDQLASLQSKVCVKTADEVIPQCLSSTTCWVQFVSLCLEHPVLALGICLSP